MHKIYIPHWVHDFFYIFYDIAEVLLNREVKKDKI